MISIVIPTYNEEQYIVKTLNNLNQLKKDLEIEIILVDGNSSDNTVKISKNLVDKVIMSKKGRYIQQNLGAQSANGSIILFLHADTIVTKSGLDILIEKKNNFMWGFFKISFDTKNFNFFILKKCINFRSIIFKYGTGDQCIFVNKDLFNEIGGFPSIALMEDVALCRILKKKYNPLIINEVVSTSTRKWSNEGFIKTILKMRLLRLMYYLGFSPSFLEKYY
ncbi:MAG: glycosyl transferase [Gammaproteobacteria bacterium]|nr:glycosyl transferase [Gammaproteobacteria bacterium]|tara:strand:+ start:20891 stop:21556 length:666 start_codon:yes stop_codon:yes gene_type:complete